MTKTLPKMWAIKSTGKKDYVTYIQPYLKKIDYHSPEWTNKNYYYCFENNMCTAYSNKPVIFTEITLEEFKTLVLKEKSVTKKPQTFCIEGKPHQIKAIYQDLVDMGYTYEKGFGVNEVKNIDTKLSQNKNPQKIANIEEFKELAAHSFNDEYDVVFNLPQDYSKVLEFAKKQLEHPYWSKDVTITLGCDDGTFDVKVEPGKSITFEGKEITITSLKSIIVNSKVRTFINSWGVNHEYVSIGCKLNIPIRDIQKVIDTYNKK
jgi:hypothetical protein